MKLNVKITRTFSSKKDFVSSFKGLDSEHFGLIKERNCLLLPT